MRKLPPPRPTELAALALARSVLRSEPTAEPRPPRPRVQLSLLGDSPEVSGPASDECYTPGAILDPISELLGGIDTDPAWSPSSLVVPKVHGYTIHQDGLTRAWVGSVWLNPPYSNPGPWVRRASEHAGAGNKVAMLINNDPSTRWWRDTLTAGVLGLWPERIRFGGDFAGGGAARFSCALILWHVPIADCAARLPRVAWYAQHGRNGHALNARGDRPGDHQ